MKVCFIGACGHWSQAYACLKDRQNVMFGGFAPGSQEEECTGSIDAAIPFFEDYKMMLDNGATATWETIDGAKAFENAGSLCHGWTAIPIIYYHRYKDFANKNIGVI